MTATTFYLDEVKGGAGPGNHGADFAIFRTPGTLPTVSVARGEYRLYTDAWIKRGRPTYIIIDVPDTDEEKS